ncbi:MAG: ankyrin repeat domain-containing protein, partial [Solirubrobacterales bacterium]
MHWAASSDDVEVLDALLDAGADIEAPGAILGGVAQHACAVAQHAPSGEGLRTVGPKRRRRALVPALMSGARADDDECAAGRRPGLAYAQVMSAARATPPIVLV